LRRRFWLFYSDLFLRETAKIRRFLNFAFLWAAFDALWV